VSQAVADFGARKGGAMVSVGFEDRLPFVLSCPSVSTRTAFGCSDGPTETDRDLAMRLANWSRFRSVM
jgi:hypothetical protein